MNASERPSLIEAHVQRSTKASGVPVKVKRRRLLLDIAQLLKR